MPIRGAGSASPMSGRVRVRVAETLTAAPRTRPRRSPGDRTARDRRDELHLQQMLPRRQVREQLRRITRHRDQLVVQDDVEVAFIGNDGGARRGHDLRVLEQTFISTVVPCTTCPFFGEMIVSLAGLAGRSALTVGVGELALGGEAASLPHEPAASAPATATTTASIGSDGLSLCPPHAAQGRSVGNGAERQRWLEIRSGPSPNRVIINHRSGMVICGTCRGHPRLHRRSRYGR